MGPGTIHCYALLQVVWTTLTVGSSLTVALAVPDQAEKIYAVVGATAVCVVCYVIPVYIQLQMFRRSKQQRKLQVRAVAGLAVCPEWVLATSRREDQGNICKLSVNSTLVLLYCAAQPSMLAHGVSAAAAELAYHGMLTLPLPLYPGRFLKRTTRLQPHCCRMQQLLMGQLTAKQQHQLGPACKRAAVAFATAFTAWQAEEDYTRLGRLFTKSSCLWQFC